MDASDAKARLDFKSKIQAFELLANDMRRSSALTPYERKGGMFV